MVPGGLWLCYHGDLLSAEETSAPPALGSLNQDKVGKSENLVLRIELEKWLQKREVPFLDDILAVSDVVFA